MVRILSFVISLLFILFVFFFTLENLSPVNINFLVQNIEAPLGITMLICFIFGAVLGLLFSVSSALKNRSRARFLAKKVEVAEQEVANLRQLPIKSSH